jgi:hypothetical protein
MEMSDWTDLEVLSRKLADSQSRLERARSTQNYGLISVLEKEIASAQSLHDRMVSHIAARLASSAPSERGRDPPSSQTSSVPSQPASHVERSEGADIVWNQLTRADIERVKRELDQRRSEMLARHAEELKALDGDQAEINILEQAIDSIARKFKLGSAEVVSLERSFSQAG